MRHALSITLLGWAALAHATTPKTGDDQWTRIDLDNVPGLVIGTSTAATKADALSAKKAQAGDKDDSPRETKKRKHRKSDAKKESERLTVVEAPALVVVADVAKPDTTMKPVEPAQASKDATAPAQVAALPERKPTTKPDSATAGAQPGATAASAASTGVGPTNSSPSSKPIVPTTAPASAAVVEPAQLAQLLKKTEASAELAQSAKKPEVAAEHVKAPPTFALSPKDRTIRAGLERWAASTGWKLSWELDEKFQNGGVVRFDADFGGDFDAALSKLAGAMRSEVKTHAYLYVGNKVLRILEEPAKPVVQPAVPMTPLIPDGSQKDIGDRGLAYVTRVKGYWLGASGTDSEAAPPQSLPPVFNASVSLIFSDKASIGTVTGILSKVTGIAILLPGAIEYPAASLFVNDAPAPTSTKKKKSSDAKSKRTYVGTPRALLDRISVSTGMLWEYKDETIVFSE